MCWAEKGNIKQNQEIHRVVAPGSCPGQNALFLSCTKPPPWQAPEKKICDMGPLKSHFTFHKYICLLSQLFTQRVNNFLHEDETQLSPTSVT